MEVNWNFHETSEQIYEERGANLEVKLSTNKNYNIYNNFSHNNST